MPSHSTLLLTRRDVADLLSLDDCIAAVGEAFKASALGTIARPGVLALPTKDGGFHIKVAALPLSRPYFAAKLNGNFPLNRARLGLPTIHGLILLSDAESGLPLAVLDSIEITILRTGAATGLAARHLAKKGASVVTIAGCGLQGRVSLRALRRVLDVRAVHAWDIDPEASRRFVDELKPDAPHALMATSSLAESAKVSDVIVTCTPSKSPILHAGDVSAGAFIAGVGADNEDKHEIDVGLLSRSVVVTDSTDQCVRIGDLHHAIEAGAVERGHVRAELGQVVAGLCTGRRDDTEVVIFDSTGTALQDVAAAAIVYERARAAGRGVPFSFFD